MFKKKVLYIDMDDTIADFYKAARRDSYGITVDESLMYRPDFFFNLEPIEGAREAIYNLEKMGFDLWILTQPLADCFESYTDKAKWIGMYFPKLVNKIVMTQDKSLHFGHYLIDDNDEKWKDKFEKTGGKFIHFKYSRTNPNSNKDEWARIIKFFDGEESVYFPK